MTDYREPVEDIFVTGELVNQYGTGVTKVGNGAARPFNAEDAKRARELNKRKQAELKQARQQGYLEAIAHLLGKKAQIDEAILDAAIASIAKDEHGNITLSDQQLAKLASEIGEKALDRLIGKPTSKAEVDVQTSFLEGLAELEA